jgi:LemA protein
MYADRIRRMRANGLLTDAQAEALEASLSPLGPADFPRRGRGPRLANIVALALIAAIFVAVVLAVLYLAGGDSTGTAIQSVSETLNNPGGTGAMNRTFSTLTSAALLSLPLVIVVAAFAFYYNRIVDKEERVFEAWSQVESNLQRRADLIPNLVETVATFMRHERETLTSVTDQRGDALSPLADAMNEVIERQRGVAEQEGAALDDEAALAQLAEAQQVLGGSIRNLVAVAEDYPNLRAGDQFLSLQAELEGTENRINVARMAFNESVGDYNSAIRRLPGTLIAGLGHFTRKAYFETSDDVAAAVGVDFDQD